jgi:hypothetical protein
LLTMFNIHFKYQQVSLNVWDVKESQNHMIAGKPFCVLNMRYVTSVLFFSFNTDCTTNNADCPWNIFTI